MTNPFRNWHPLAKIALAFCAAVIIVNIISNRSSQSNDVAVVTYTPQPNATIMTPRASQTLNPALIRTNTPEQVEPTDAPVAPPPKPDRHDERQTALEWYSKIINSMAIAHAAAEVSGDFIQQGQLVAASSILKKASETAGNAYDESVNSPEGWSDAGERFNTSAKDLQATIDGLRKYLDDQSPSILSDAQDSLTSSVSEYGEAVHDARVHFVDMGGKWSDLSDGQEMEKDAAALFRSTE